MGAATVGNSILQDARRMGPVFAIVAGTALCVVLSLRGLAKHQLRDALQSSPNACEYAQVHVQSASQLLEKLRNDAALKLQKAPRNTPAQGVLKGDPRIARARTELHEALSLCPEISIAENDLSLLELYDGNTSESWYRQGLFQAKTGKTAEAIVSLQTALAEDPNLLRAVPRLAVLLRDAGREGEAFALVQEHEAELATTAEGKLLLGRLYAGDTTSDKAERYLREGLQEQPVDARALWELTGIFQRTKRAEEGAEFFASLGKPGRRVIPETFHCAATLYLEAGDLPREEAMLKKTIELAPSNGRLMYSLAVNLHRQQKTSEARDMMNRALEQDFSGVMEDLARVGVDPRK